MTFVPPEILILFATLRTERVVRKVAEAFWLGHLTTPHVRGTKSREAATDRTAEQRANGHHYHLRPTIQVVRSKPSAADTR